MRNEREFIVEINRIGHELKSVDEAAEKQFNPF